MTTAAPHRETDTARPAGKAEMMQAIVQRGYGTAPEDVLQYAEVPQPVTGDAEVLVRVRGASVDRGTVHLMTGLPYLIRLLGFGLRAPKQTNPGRSLAGVVESVGKDVTAFKPGDEVYGSCDGSFAEYVSATVGLLAVKPTNISFEEAATLPISAVAALQAVRDRGEVRAGQHVLIVGAAGGVGGCALQIAKAFGAEVTGVCSTAQAELVRAMGADHIVDYTREDFVTQPNRYDVIVDTAGHRRLSDLRRALTHRGTLVLVGSETNGRLIGGFDRQLRAPLMSLLVSQKLRMLTSKENADDLSVLRGLIESGKVTPAVGSTYPLSEAAAAIRHLIDGHAAGKVVVTV